MVMLKRAMLLLVAALLATASCTSIDDHGGVPNDASNAAAAANTKALEDTLQQANGSDKVALVPAGKSYYVFNVESSGLRGVRLQIDGALLASDSMSAWPNRSSNSTYTYAALSLYDCHDLTLTGDGVFDGQGYVWWWEVILFHVDNRPHLVAMDECTNVTIENLKFVNSPQFHLRLSGMKGLHVRNVTIYVDIEGQREMLQKANLYNAALDIPTFPLNTDGIDPSGVDVLIEDINIQNFDDAVAVKPMHSGGRYSNCSQNMLIRNAHVKYGVGMTIGSVSPNARHNCVRNITFENVHFDSPLKGIYIKTDPGDSGDGEIDNITYRNISMSSALWYPIWIGPQQQKQPGSKGTGCSFLYPVVDECPTQPRVSISNVQLIDVSSTGGWSLPGVLLCNSTRPCTGFRFHNVTSSGAFLLQRDYVCKNIQGTVESCDPKPDCFG